MSSLYENAIQEAEKIGREHGVSAGSWVIDGNTTNETAAWYLRGFEDGDPEVYDALPSNPLSGEWADSYSPADLYRDLQWSEDADLSGSILDAYERGYSEGVEDEVARAAKAILS